jgi:hypothetical protein
MSSIMVKTGHFYPLLASPFLRWRRVRASSKFHVKTDTEPVSETLGSIRNTRRQTKSRNPVVERLSTEELAKSWPIQEQFWSSMKLASMLKYCLTGTTGVHLPIRRIRSKEDQWKTAVHVRLKNVFGMVHRPILEAVISRFNVWWPPISEFKSEMFSLCNIEFHHITCSYVVR